MVKRDFSNSYIYNNRNKILYLSCKRYYINNNYKSKNILFIIDITITKIFFYHDINY